MSKEREKGQVDTSYLDAAAALLEPIKQLSYDMLRASPGQRLLDVGCGPGIDTLALSRRVCPGGRVLGVDADGSMVSIANQRAQQAGVADSVQHLRADAASLPADDNAFDGSRSERLFIHLGNPLRALEEMVRVTRPGGRIVVVDTDWGSLSIDTTQPETERALARFRAERSLNNGYSGRQLYRLFKCCHLHEIEIRIHPVVILGDARLARYLTQLTDVEEAAVAANAVTADALDAWRRELNDADLTGTFFGTLSMVLAAGLKS